MFADCVAGLVASNGAGACRVSLPIMSHRMGRDCDNVRHERMRRDIGRNRALLFSEVIR